MELTATFVRSLPGAAGETKGKPWVRHEFLVQTMDPYGKEILMQAWNNRGDVLKTLRRGDEIRIHFDLSSAEYKGRWTTYITALSIESLNTRPVGAPKAKPPVQRRTEPVYEPVYEGPTDQDNRLPY